MIVLQGMYIIIIIISIRIMGRSSEGEGDGERWDRGQVRQLMKVGKLRTRRSIKHRFTPFQYIPPPIIIIIYYYY